MYVFVTQDNEGNVVGVTTTAKKIQVGKAKGLRTTQIVLDGMMQVGPEDRPWVVYFKEANIDKPQVWPIAEGFPEEDGPRVFPEGIEYCVYAENAALALSRVYGKLHFDSWDLAVSQWKENYE
jgi:hypothetical protein